MSRAKALLATVLELVSSETDVAVSKIMSRCSEAEVVDARWICVKLLSDKGYYPVRIADMMKITPRYVQYILTDFEDRILVCQWMRNNYESLVNKLRKN